MMVATLLHLLDNPIATTPERTARARHCQAIAIGNTSLASINSSVCRALSESSRANVMMLDEKTLDSPPDTFRDDQKLHERRFKGNTDNYTKYAGETPDGGLKAWSVIMAYVLCRALLCSLP
ncbi:hypothetical protein BKA82DRAFT_556323 [Pisolithus tinctorius]|uniref:Uncharacterized protein n=1 Tax=Pisolithus tinctorius Marx 270 TaxID=870435 RepID=A0A0C3P9I4_PISTI|nr:hypothetical protein BKA82DRAFT_556323 [Pisolithus tinctorius]KIO04204.1 hypothetical protein M404DRAFT_556323 [Pisolithus tinctorius Marx 270]